MKLILNLIATFLVAIVGWTLLSTGLTVLGVAVLALCSAYAYVFSVYQVFGSFRNYLANLEEIQLWTVTMIP